MAHLLPEAPITTIEEYWAVGGGRGIARAVDLGPEGTIEEIRRAGLRGRGGGGFPTATKWTTVRRAPGTRRFLVVNGAEGEPGTFKDRTILRANAYQVVEGAVIAAFAVGADEAFVCVKAAFTEEHDALTRAAAELQRSGICPDCRLTVVGGPDEYLYGEEKAMLEVIEGKDPLPRLFPPYEHGLFVTAPQEGWSSTPQEPGHPGLEESNPTVVNNVETLANVPHILEKGADWFRSFGTDRSPGTIVCTVVGDTQRAGVAEVELGTPLRDVIDHVGGGPRSGRRVKAVCSGVANAVVTADHLDVPVSYEGFTAIGSGMGSAGFVVFDDEACMVEVARRFSQFLYVESCGQCPACKTGSGEITRLLQAIEAGYGEPRHLDELAAWLDKVTDGNRCFLAVEERAVVLSIVQAFADEVAEHLELGRCPRPKRIVMPKLVDVRDGTAVYDERNDLKQPDWTYASPTA
jgi:NADH-quinone oxidoreductase subunit F